MRRERQGDIYPPILSRLAKSVKNMYNADKAFWLMQLCGDSPNCTSHVPCIHEEMNPTAVTVCKTQEQRRSILPLSYAPPLLLRSSEGMSTLLAASCIA